MTLVQVMTWDEVKLYATVGIERRISGLKENRQNTYNMKAGDEWKNDIEGAGGEMAVAKALGLYWSGALGVLRAPDLSGYARRIEVRTTAVPTGHLLLHPRDPDNAICILVVGSTPRFELKGWILGKDGKLKVYEKELNPGRPAFCVPQEALRRFPIGPVEAPAPQPPATDGPLNLTAGDIPW
jgi:hypothetical protein